MPSLTGTSGSPDTTGVGGAMFSSGAPDALAAAADATGAADAGGGGAVDAAEPAEEPSPCPDSPDFSQPVPMSVSSRGVIPASHRILRFLEFMCAACCQPIRPADRPFVGPHFRST